MAERNLESNIVLQTVLPQPKGNGFEALHRQLGKIESKLLKLSDREYKIKVTLDDGGLSASNLKVTSTLKKAGAEAKKQTQEVSNAVYQMGDKMQSATGDMLTNIRTAITATEKGVKKVITETREDVSNRLQSKRQFTETPTGFKQVESVTDLAAKQRLKDQKASDPAVIAARNQAITNKATLDDYKQTIRLIQQEEKQNGKTLENTKKQQKKQEEDLNKITNRAVLEDYKNTGKVLQNEAKQQKKQEEDLNKITNRAVLEDYKNTGKLLTKEASDQKKQQADLNKITNRAVLQDYKQTGRLLVQESKEQAKAAILASNQAAARQVIQGARGEGFVRQEPTSQRFNTKTGRLEQVEEFKRVTVNALKGYTVEIIKANAATGEFNPVDL